MKAYILANGEAKRWGNYRNCDKQLITINDEPLLDRIVRLLKNEGLKKDEIIICGKYKYKDSTNIITKSKTKREVFQELAEIEKEPFIILYGDTYYTDTIIHDLVTRDIKQYGEWFTISPNPNTGKKWAEGYAHKVVDVKWFKKEITELNKKVDSGEIEWTKDWIIHWWLLGEKDRIYEHPVKCIDPDKDIYWCDETDDFDFPNDLEHFLKTTGYKGPEKNDYLSIIIPNYNNGKYLKSLLDKLTYQKETSYPETEILVIDDGSTEDTSYLDEYKSIRVIRTENFGVSHARNLGIENTSGDYLQFVDSDDDITDDFLHVIYTNIRTGCDYCLYRWINNGTLTKGPIHDDSLLWNWAVWGYTFTRACINTARFDETLNISEDIEWLREIIFPHLNRLIVDTPIYIYNSGNEDSLCHKFHRGEIGKSRCDK